MPSESGLEVAGAGVPEGREIRHQGVVSVEDDDSMKEQEKEGGDAS